MSAPESHAAKVSGAGTPDGEREQFVAASGGGARTPSPRSRNVASVCLDCGHPASCHGPDGCEVEVRDYGEMDCTCEAVFVGHEPVGTRRFTPEGGVALVQP